MSFGWKKIDWVMAGAYSKSRSGMSSLGHEIWDLTEA